MKKKLLITLLITTTLIFTGCSEWSTEVNINSEDESGTKQVGLRQFKKINNSFLYYDINTNIVYLWNGNIGYFSQAATTPSPYYAPNGLPYKYNSAINALEEIQKGE